MKRPVVLYIATSLDGYIARENGAIDWLYEVEGEGDGGYGEFYNTIDTVLMGNKTYEHTFELADHFPYPDKECYVFSRSGKEPSPHVAFVTEDVPGFIEKLKKREGSKIWIVGGAEILDVLMKRKLVDEFIITMMPTLLGEGIPLFKPGNPELKLVLAGTKRFGQMVQLHYTVKNDNS
ncbi:MAG: dihydrofolate reductase family protein [Paenibacillus dendritiformis]|uniref:dihydrofolate reductase family protein n=1 Tax=Paenibacillus dendritiformis TaxID=130049 RepID=UPI00143D2350|nr:dihydrofolate reductase family protein [Paenibacillus dendritiformis]MDU5145879.1 dihydrofolate reductase family protein [Paenibacillus dendritiformis]NKI21914.1 dihydrofolate reductase [Paenibacillus dendritiformis]NRG00330.1 dihydrofolate reductase [Paenibacillus dendritiformis]